MDNELILFLSFLKVEVFFKWVVKFDLVEDEGVS